METEIERASEYFSNEFIECLSHALCGARRRLEEEHVVLSSEARRLLVAHLPACIGCVCTLSAIATSTCTACVACVCSL